MVDTHDPAGWYPDPTGNHELRYWDGYAWLDNVSDQGATSTDPLGGKPMPTPTQLASQPAADQAPPPVTKKSRTPIIVAAAVVAVLLIVAVVVLVTRGGDDGNGTTALKDKPVTFTDEGKDAAHPTPHAFAIDANTAVKVKVSTDESDLTPVLIVETDKGTIDKVDSQISGLSDFLTSNLKDVCPNLREEDIGAKGDVLYDVGEGSNPGDDLKFVTVIPIKGTYEFTAVLRDDAGKCQAGKLTMTVTPEKRNDLSDVSDTSDLASVLSDLGAFSS